MRRILIEKVRRKQTLKRGGQFLRADFEAAGLAETAPAEEMVLVDEALDELAASDPTAADLVKLRYFVGMTMDEAAVALDMPLRRAERLWTFAKTWLRHRLTQTR
jgi:RNA polymerase sigma factor (TIGR02999 family)